MRILCLHGMGTSNRIFEMQTAVLRWQLREHKFEFIEGAIDCPAAPGVDELLSDDDTQFAYYNPNDPESILTAIQDLSIYVDQEGPFDGVMGFSQGAALGAMLLARNNHPSFSFGIFICSGAPLCESGLSKGALHPLRPDINGEPIKVPTAHIIGGKDASLPESLACAAVCAEALRTVYDHGAGHEIPLGAVGNNKVGEMVSCIQKVITRAEFMQ